MSMTALISKQNYNNFNHKMNCHRQNRTYIKKGSKVTVTTFNDTELNFREKLRIIQKNQIGNFVDCLYRLGPKDKKPNSASSIQRDAQCKTPTLPSGNQLCEHPFMKAKLSYMLKGSMKGQNGSRQNMGSQESEEESTEDENYTTVKIQKLRLNSNQQSQIREIIGKMNKIRI